MGLVGTWHMPVHVPVLFLSAQYDAFARFTGRPQVAYARLENPKYEVTVRGGAHIWFTDVDGPHADGGNPELTTPTRQREITQIAVIDFLDGYLRDDKARLAQLHNLAKILPDVDERNED
jgi:hypothetical protein